MVRILLMLSAMVSGLALFFVADSEGFAFLGNTLTNILWYVGVISVLIFGLTLIVLGVRALVWPQGNRDA